MRADQNPWACSDPMLAGCIIRDSGERIQQIKNSSDIKWLQSVLRYRDNQVTVIQAAQRRLRQLQKGGAR